jgi:cellulose synthase/poly-beta-1,6-N-acetylglucosamine synthase-like glycosyltransferase
MIRNPEIDVLGFDGLSYHYSVRTHFVQSSFISGFQRWQKDKTPFLFCGLSLLLRRSSLSYLGLFSTRYKIIDMEYTIRISATKAKIAFCAGFGFVNIVNPDSNSSKFYDVIRSEKKELSSIYPSISSELKIHDLFLRAKDQLIKIKGRNNEEKQKSSVVLGNYPEIVKQSLFQLEAKYAENPPSFLK